MLVDMCPSARQVFGGNVQIELRHHFSLYYNLGFSTTPLQPHRTAYEQVLAVSTFKVSL